eukprot:764106-Hanusia_phi.AAC.3
MGGRGEREKYRRGGHFDAVPTLTSSPHCVRSSCNACETSGEEKTNHKSRRAGDWEEQESPLMLSLTASSLSTRLERFPC